MTLSLENPLDGASYASLPDWSAVHVTGADAGAFLQNFCTNDIAALVPGAACEAFFTDVKAHIIAYAIVARDDEGFVCVLSSDRATTLAEHLDRYLIREDAQLDVVDAPLWLVGARTSADAGFVYPAAGWGAGVCMAIGDRDWGDASPIDPTLLERVRIALGVPRDGVDVDTRNLPQEVDRNEQAISFTKGCYLGQEPVARIDALGRVNWLLRGVRNDGEPVPAGAELFCPETGKSVGRVTSSAATSEGAIGLAYVRREHADDGTPLKTAEGSATVHRVPMLRPS